MLKFVDATAEKFEEGVSGVRHDTGRRMVRDSGSGARSLRRKGRKAAAAVAYSGERFGGLGALMVRGWGQMDEMVLGI